MKQNFYCHEKAGGFGARQCGIQCDDCRYTQKVAGDEDVYPVTPWLVIGALTLASVGFVVALVVYAFL